MQNSCEFTTRLQTLCLHMPIDGVAKISLQAKILAPGRIGRIHSILQNKILKSLKTFCGRKTAASIDSVVKETQIKIVRTFF